MAEHREPKDSDFTLDIEGVGSWTFARRTLRDAMQIRREIVRLCGDAGTGKDMDLDGWASVLASLTVLTVSCPEEYEDLEGLDMLAPDNKIAKVMRVWGALLDKEDSFRGIKKTPRKKGGARDVGQPDLLVSPQVPAATE